MLSFLIGLFLGFVLALLALAGFYNSKQRDEYQSIREWCSAAYSVLELGVQLMPRDIFPNWTGVSCILDSCPLEVNEYE